MADINNKINEALEIIEDVKNTTLIAQSKLDDAEVKLKELGYESIDEAKAEIEKLEKQAEKKEKLLKDLEEDLEDELKSEDNDG